MGVADFDDIAQLSVGRRRTAFGISIPLRRRDIHKALGSVLVDERRDRRTFGAALHAPVGPEEEENDLAFELIEAGHAGADV